jgi:hypothetical protein
MSILIMSGSKVSNDLNGNRGGETMKKMKKTGILLLASFLGIGAICWVLTFLFPLLPLETATPPLIRLHILANSDTPEDQELKYRAP